MNRNPVDQQNLNPLLEQLRARKSDIMSIATEHGASNIRVFGSVARGEANNHYEEPPS